MIIALFIPDAHQPPDGVTDPGVKVGAHNSLCMAYKSPPSTDRMGWVMGTVHPCKYIPQTRAVTVDLNDTVS